MTGIWHRRLIMYAIFRNRSFSLLRVGQLVSGWSFIALGGRIVPSGRAARVLVDIFDRSRLPLVLLIPFLILLGAAWHYFGAALSFPILAALIPLPPQLATPRPDNTRRIHADLPLGGSQDPDLLRAYTGKTCRLSSRSIA